MDLCVRKPGVLNKLRCFVSVRAVANHQAFSKPIQEKLTFTCTSIVITTRRVDVCIHFKDKKCIKAISI